MITDHRRALLDAMLRAEGLDAPGEEVTPEPRTSGIPLSFAQESVWAAEQLRPGTAAYHVPLLIRLRGPLDAGALGRAVEWTINRRDALRVTFDVQDGVASQRVADPLAGFRLTVVEPDGANCEQRREAVGTRALADLLVPFD